MNTTEIHLYVSLIFSFSWVKKIHLGRGSSGRRLDLLNFMKKQKRRTKARLNLLKKRKRTARRRADLCLSMSAAREKWRRGSRNARTKYLLAPLHGERLTKRKEH